MEHITNLITNGLIWDDKYLELDIPREDIKNNLDTVRIILSLIIRGMKEEKIDTRFYYLGKSLAKKSKLMVFDLSDPNVSLGFDVFLTFEEIEEDYDYSESKIFWHVYEIKSIWEYFILSRSLINYDFESCLPHMHKIDLNNTDFLGAYKEVKSKLAGRYTKPARKV